jgi:hypothetical protein
MTARLPAARLGTDYSEDYPVYVSRSLDLGLTWNSAELDYRALAPVGSGGYVAMGVTAATRHGQSSSSRRLGLQ